jgi:hypothetical protein
MLHFVETAEFGKFKLKEIHSRVDMGQFQTVIRSWDRFDFVWLKFFISLWIYGYSTVCLFYQRNCDRRCCSLKCLCTTGCIERPSTDDGHQEAGWDKSQAP